MDDLQDRVSNLELELQLKDQELELAAELGKALVRKETKMSREVDALKRRGSNIAEELVRTKAECEALRNGNTLTEQDHSWIGKVHVLEEANAKLQFELKRSKLVHEHAANIQLTSKSVLASRNAEIIRLRAAASQFETTSAVEVQRLKELHETELRALKEANETQVQEFMRVSEKDTDRLMECMETQLGTLREQMQGQFVSEDGRVSFSLSNSSSETVDVINESDKGTSERSTEHTNNVEEITESVEGSRAAVQAVQRFPPLGLDARAHTLASPRHKSHSSSMMSLASNFSTRTLELELDLSNDDNDEDDDDGYDDEGEEEGEEGGSGEKEQEPLMPEAQMRAQDEKASTLDDPLRDVRKPPPIPSHEELQRKEMLVLVEVDAATSAPSGETTGEESTGTTSSLPPPLVPPALKMDAATPTHTDRKVEAAVATVAEPGRPQVLQKRTASARSMLSSSGNSTSSKGRRLLTGKRHSTAPSSSGTGSKEGGFHGSWAAAAMLGEVLVKMKHGAKSDRWVVRYCIFVDGQLYVFRQLSDAQQYSVWAAQQREQRVQCHSASKRKLAFKPLSAVTMDQTELRVIRRALAQDENPADARTSMLAWLKKRDVDTREYAGKSGPGGNKNKPRHRPLYKIQIVQRKDANGSNAGIDLGPNSGGEPDFCRDGAESLASATSFDSEATAASSSSLLAPAHGHHLFLGFSGEDCRQAWLEAFTRASAARQVQAGSVWIKSRRLKEEDQWIKRLAVVRHGKLELREYDTEAVRETVSLASVKVEPAYSAHIFISHKQHQKQLITLRAYDGTERNWWLAALRSCAAQGKTRHLLQPTPSTSASAFLPHAAVTSFFGSPIVPSSLHFT